MDGGPAMTTQTAAVASAPLTTLTRYEHERIEYRVNRLARAFHLGHHDIQDLRSEFTTELLRGLRRFDPQRASRRTYSERVLSKPYLNIARRLGASARRAEQIGTPPHAKEGLPDWRPDADRRMDVEGALKRLPRKLRMIAE